MSETLGKSGGVPPAAPSALSRLFAKRGAKPGENGFTFPVGDTDTLAERLSWILAHPVAATAAGAQAAVDAARYDWDNVATETVSVYEDAARSVNSMRPHDENAS